MPVETGGGLGASSNGTPAAVAWASGLTGGGGAEADGWRGGWNTRTPSTVTTKRPTRAAVGPMPLRIHWARQSVERSLTSAGTSTSPTSAGSPSAPSSSATAVSSSMLPGGVSTVSRTRKKGLLGERKPAKERCVGESSAICIACSRRIADRSATDGPDDMWGNQITWAGARVRAFALGRAMAMYYARTAARAGGVCGLLLL